MKLYTTILMLIGCLFFSLALRAQEQSTPTNRLSFVWGLGNLARQDQIFSPFVHRSSSFLNVALRYERSGKLRQKLNISFSQYHPATSDAYTYWWDDPQETFTTYPHDFLLVNLDYGIAGTLWKTEHTQIVVGGMLHHRVQPSYYNFGTFSVFGYLASLGLGPWLEGVWQPNEKSQLSASCSLPLVAWAARSPYLANDDEYMRNTYSHSFFKIFGAYLADGGFQTISRFQQVDLQLQYRYVLGTKWDLFGEYNFSLMHYSQPAKLLSFQHLIALGGSLKF